MHRCSDRARACATTYDSPTSVHPSHDNTGKGRHVQAQPQVRHGCSNTTPIAKDPNWCAAMQSVFDALKANGTWSLVLWPPNAHVIAGKWVLKIKLNPDGTLQQYKARWVVCGFHQHPGIDFTETFSPVVKLATIRTVLALIAGHD